MLPLDDPSLSAPYDPRTGLIVDMLTVTVHKRAEIEAALEAAKMRPGDYKEQAARLTWAAVVPDAARQGKLAALIASVVKQNAAFGRELERRWQSLVKPSGIWYRHDDPYSSCFVSVRASRAVIDREGLRSGLRDLAEDQFWVLVVQGRAGSGKSHSWHLIAHLRDAGKLIGMHDFVRVTTHDWAGEVTGEDLILALADKLELKMKLTPSAELDDARIRKLVDMLEGRFRSLGRDGVIRWIILDGLDRPGVQNSVRDVAKRLITMVDEGQLKNTRLIITGLDGLGPTPGPSVTVEEIPSIDEARLRKFLTDVAEHLGHAVTSQELDICVAEVLGTQEPCRGLHEIGNAVVRLVQKRWVEGA